LESDPTYSVDEVQKLLGAAEYVADRRLATAAFLALKLGRPLFLEGEAGVGKTELAKALARALGRPLIRLQCYEGLDISSAVYEWNVQRQMTAIRIAEASGTADKAALERDLFSSEYLVKRPILQALEASTAAAAPVLLIDELDRADEPFEAYLLEVLSDFQVTIPELGTVRAAHPPVVVVTSNRTREIHDAIKRRCLYHWVDYPSAARELEIVRLKAPGAAEALSREVVAFVQRLRTMDLYKAPGVAETIDWTRSLLVLDALSLDPQTVSDTLGTLLKYQDDIARLQRDEVAVILQDVKSRLAA
jgi:MoxR-like ATPase